jgi:hypothetical protein
VPSWKIESLPVRPGRDLLELTRALNSSCNISTRLRSLSRGDADSRNNRLNAFAVLIPSTPP